MDKRTKGCLWIGLGIAIVGVMLVVAIVAGAGYWAYQSFAPDATFLEPDKAEAELAAIRARFPNQKPLIDADDDGHGAELRTEGRSATFTGELQGLHIAAYDQRAKKLVRFSVPFWMLRMAPDGKVSVGDGMLEDVRGAEKLTVKDLEALGPGLIIDEQKPGGDRVLVWTE
jgi:hypothetical protein